MASKLIKQTVYTCDRCATQHVENGENYPMQWRHTIRTGCYGAMEEKIDLCPSCEAGLHAYLTLTGDK